RHILVKGRASPDDPQLKEYWMKRQERQAKDLTISKQKLSKRQTGRWVQCFESLFNGEDIQVHRLLSPSQGGKDAYSNLVLVHHLCHQQIHARTDRALSDCQQSNDLKLSVEGSQRARTFRPEE
ncbi:MAG: HNH endonuclease, partial [Ktedonobacteraceae bacterium]